MAEPITAGVFPTTLLLLYFVVPAANVPTNESKETQEKKALWTFQSSSQIQLPDPDTCTSTALQMMAEIKPVRTMTVRAYCLCPLGTETRGNKECFNEPPKVEARIARKKAGEEDIVARPVVRAIGPSTPDPFAPKPDGKKK
jgi:hypothetical protein